MNAFDRAFGKNKLPGDILASPNVEQQSATVQEKMLASVLGKLIPGFDLNTINKIGVDVTNAMTFFVTTLQRIEQRQVKMEVLLLKLEQDLENGDYSRGTRRACTNGTDH